MVLADKINLYFVFQENKETNQKKCVKTEVLKKKGYSKQSKQFCCFFFTKFTTAVFLIYCMFVVKDGVGDSSYASALVCWVEYL